MSRLIVGVAAVVIVALTHGSACAKRLLTATVELDGQAVLETKFSDDGARTPETVWRYLSKPPGWAELSHIEAAPENPQQADLAGELVIRIQHVDRPIVEAEPSPLETTGGQRIWWIAGGALVALTAIIGIFQLIRSKRRSPSAD